MDKCLQKISTRIYLEHQSNNIRAVILYTLIGIISVITLFVLQLAIRLQRVAAAKGCTIYFQPYLKAFCMIRTWKLEKGGQAVRLEE